MNNNSSTRLNIGENMQFNPKPEYTIVSDNIHIKDFYDFSGLYVTRPPYQRKTVWSVKKKQSLMDSLIRGYYIPRLVIREVRKSDTTTVSEVVDGQQRINAVQDFFCNTYPLPKTLEDISKDVGGSYYSELDDKIKMSISRNLKFKVDIIKNIELPDNEEHQMIATEIFWRLQQGESLNYMEVAHAQLSSLTRNFIVKYADDQTFDYDNYKPVDNNPDKHRFFSLLNVDNIRMKHLQFLARFVMIEQGGGYADLSDRRIEEFISQYKTKNGIGDNSFEKKPEAISALKTLNVFYETFEDDPMLDDKNGLKELSIEYFIISFYMLIRHLRIYYVVNDDIKNQIRGFLYYFHKRWKTYDESEDHNLLAFSNSRQQGIKDLETRDRIMRQVFFEYLKDKGITILEKDAKRAFSELERIIIYRRDKGLCQECIREGKPEREARISWSNFQADHVLPHSKGGKTVIENGELLCETHNKSKGCRV